MSNKNKKQPFFWFMMDHQSKERRNGRNLSMGDLVSTCAPLWDAMSNDQKQFYKDKAQQFKARQFAQDIPNQGPSRQSHRSSSVASTATSATSSAIGSVYERSDTVLNGISDRDQALLDIVGGIASLPMDKLLEQDFMIISFNVTVVTQNDTHMPNEICVANFKLGSGLDMGSVFHKFINCGRVPPGYQRAAIEHAEKTHKIPIESFPDAFTGKRNFATLIKKIDQFAQERGVNYTYEGMEIHPIFCKADQMHQVRGCFRQLALMSEDDEAIDIFNRKLVFIDLARFLFHLCDRSKKFNPPRPYPVCENDLNHGHYDFNEKALCHYHLDRHLIHCARGLCVRTVFLFFDVVCRVLDIKPTRNHCPELGQKLARPKIAGLPDSDSDEEEVTLSRRLAGVKIDPSEAIFFQTSAGRGRGRPVSEMSNRTLDTESESGDIGTMMDLIRQHRLCRND